VVDVTLTPEHGIARVSTSVHIGGASGGASGIVSGVTFRRRVRVPVVELRGAVGDASMLVEKPGASSSKPHAPRWRDELAC